MSRFTAAGLPEQIIPGPYFDEEGRFRSVLLATQHAIIVQGGFTTCDNEAERMTRSTDEIERKMGTDYLAGTPMATLPGPEPTQGTRTAYVANSEARTLTPVEEAIDEAMAGTPEANAEILKDRDVERQMESERKTKQIRRLVRQFLAAKAERKTSDTKMNKLKPEILKLAYDLGLDEVEVEAGKVQVITPGSIGIPDQDELIKRIQQHRPELLDRLAPATRSVSKEELAKAIEDGDVPAGWQRFLVRKTGTTQLR